MSKKRILVIGPKEDIEQMQPTLKQLEAIVMLVFCKSNQPEKSELSEDFSQNSVVQNPEIWKQRNDWRNSRNKRAIFKNPSKKFSKK